MVPASGWAGDIDKSQYFNSTLYNRVNARPEDGLPVVTTGGFNSSMTVMEVSQGATAEYSRDDGVGSSLSA